MKNFLTALSLVVLLGCQGNDESFNSPGPTSPTPDLSTALPSPVPVPSTSIAPSAPEVFVKNNPESLIECIESERSGMASHCRLLQPSITLAENPKREMRTYRVEYEMSCYHGRSEIMEIRIRAQVEDEGEVVGLLRTGKRESYYIRGTGDLIIEDLSPKVLGYRTFSRNGCDLVIKFKQLEPSAAISP